MDTMKEGLAFGIGSSLGHKITDGIFKTKEVNEPEKKDVFKLYNECMENSLIHNKHECQKILESNTKVM